MKNFEFNQILFRGHDRYTCRLIWALQYMIETYMTILQGRCCRVTGKLIKRTLKFCPRFNLNPYAHSGMN